MDFQGKQLRGFCYGKMDGDGDWSSDDRVFVVGKLDMRGVLQMELIGFDGYCMWNGEDQGVINVLVFKICVFG